MGPLPSLRRALPACLRRLLGTASALLVCASAAAQDSTAYSVAVIEDAPVLYWNFDQQEGIARQLMPVSVQPVGGENDLQPAGDATRVAHAEIGSGLHLGATAEFGGAGAFVGETLRAGRSTLPGAWGVEFWVQFLGDVGGTGRNEYLVNFSGNAPAVIHDYTPAEIELYTTGAAIGGRTAGGPLLFDNGWHHVLFVYYGDGTDGVADRVDAYIDGDLLPDIGNFITQRLTLANIIVGASSASGGNGLRGRLDELVIYDWSELPDEPAVTSRALEIVQQHRSAANNSESDYSATVLAHEPALYWSFNENEGPAIQQAAIVFPPVTTENDLLPQGNAMISSHGDLGSGLDLGQAADLDGASHFEVEQLRAPFASLPPPWALEFWMQVQGENSGERQNYLVAFGPTGNDPAFIYDYKPDQLEIFSGVRTDNGPIVDDEEWHHVVWVYYGSASDGVADRVDAYLDGIPIPDIRNDFARALRMDSTLRVGASLPGGMNGFLGRLDEVAIYDLRDIGEEADVQAHVEGMIARHRAAAFGIPAEVTLEITQQPVSVTGVLGGTATFSVQATLSGAPTGAEIEYQWMRNGVEIPGATEATYTTPALSLADVGENAYRVRLAYGVAVMLSEPAILAVEAPPAPAPTAYSAEVLRDEPIAYWNFDEPTGSAIQRAPLPDPAPITIENDLVPMPGAFRSAHADIGSGLDLGATADLDGTGYFEAGPLRAGRRSLSPPWAVEFWIQALGDNSAERQDYLVAFGPSGNDPAFIYDYKPDQLEIFHGPRTDGGPVISDEEWHHVFWVFYGTESTGVADRADAFLDGIRIPDVRNDFGRDILLDSTVRVGAALPGGIGGFEGRIDEVAIYDLAPAGDLAAVESRVESMVQARIQRARGSSGVPYSELILADDPVLYWNFDEPDGNALQLAPVVPAPPDNSLNALAPAGGTRVDHAVIGSGLKLGYAADFDGSGRFQTPLLELGVGTLPGPYALEIWFQALGPNDGERQDYLANVGPNAPGIIYDYNPDELELYGGEGGRTAGGPLIADTDWHHLLWVYYGDGTSGVAARVDAWLDGEAHPHIGNFMSRALTPSSLVVGAATLQGANGFQGRIDEFAIYDLSHLTDEAAVEAAMTDMVERHLGASTVEAPSRPALAAALSGNELTLSWEGTGWRLEQTDDLASDQWAPVAGGDSSPVVVTLEPEGARFYRLRDL